MMCFIFSVAVLCLTLAGLLLMVGWKTGAAQLARVAVALVIGSAIIGWFLDALRAVFSRSAITAVAGGLVLLLILAGGLLFVGWFIKRRSEVTPANRPTIRRRAALLDAEKAPEALPRHATASSTDDLNIFGAGQ